MKKPKMRLNRSHIIRLSLGLLVIPFLVGFDYPDSTGTYAKISAGGGSYRFSPGCSRYNYKADFQETEIALQHRIAIKPRDGATTFWSKWTPSYINFAVNGDMINKQIKVVSYDSSTDDFGQRRGPSPDEAKIGSRSDAIGLAAGAKVGLDWRWLGAVIGASVNSYGKGEEEKTGPDWAKNPIVLPIAGLRLGDNDLAYISWDFLGSSPIASGGGALDIGVGGKVGTTRLWGGYGAAPYRGKMAVLKASRPLGPISLSIAGDIGVENFSKFEEYGIAVGVGYRLPWNW
jgi:hypothetical protein